MTDSPIHDGLTNSQRCRDFITAEYASRDIMSAKTIDKAKDGLVFLFPRQKLRVEADLQLRTERGIMLPAVDDLRKRVDGILQHPDSDNVLSNLKVTILAEMMKRSESHTGNSSTRNTHLEHE